MEPWRTAVRRGREFLANLECRAAQGPEDWILEIRSLDGCNHCHFSRPSMDLRKDNPLELRTQDDLRDRRGFGSVGNHLSAHASWSHIQRYGSTRVDAPTSLSPPIRARLCAGHRRHASVDIMRDASAPLPARETVAFPSGTRPDHGEAEVFATAQIPCLCQQRLSPPQVPLVGHLWPTCTP